MMSTLYTLLLLFPIFHPAYSSFQCQTMVQKVEEIPIGVDMSYIPLHHRTKRSTINKLRVHLEYDSSFKSLDHNEFIKTNIIEVAVSNLVNVVKAKLPISEPLRVDRQCVRGLYSRNKQNESACTSGCTSQTQCYGYTIPDKYLKKCASMESNGTVVYTESEGSGMDNTDLVIMVVSQACAQTTLASAGSCILENSLDRPIFGALNICPGQFLPNTQVLRNIHVIQHELIHVLGFQVEKFAYFRNRDGTPKVPRTPLGFPGLGIHPKGFYKWNDQIAREVNRTRFTIHGNYTKTIDAFTLPNVVKAAREHFNCSELNELDLEDYGPTGTAYSHFDEYFLNDELMTPMIDGFINPFSAFSLAFLYDTGWYDVDFSKAEKLKYGKNKGCDFPIKGCYHYMEKQRAENKSLDPFCDKYFQTGNVSECSADRNYYAICFIVSRPNLLTNFQYFEHNTSWSGIAEHNEYCPMKEIPTNPSSNCHDTLNINRPGRYSFFPFNFGDDSKCFGINTDTPNVYYGAACLKYKCDLANQSYIVLYNNQTFDCSATATSTESYNVHRILLESNHTTNFTCASFSSVCLNSSSSELFQPYQIIPSTPLIVTTTKKSSEKCLINWFYLWIYSMVTMTLLKDYI